MGRMSTRENKNCYQKRREELGLSRETASEMLCMSPDRLEKIENEKLPIRPEEVLAMSDAYKKPTLCNHYCSTECPIGKQYVRSKSIPTNRHGGFAHRISSIARFY